MRVQNIFWLPRLLFATISVLTLTYASGMDCAFAQNAESGSPSKKSNFPYMRVDFQVKASCVSCIRRVIKSLKATRGVISADVSIYHPHWGVVVIDNSQTDVDKIIAKVKKEKADVDKLTKVDLREKPIFVVPRSDTPAKL